MLAVDIDKDRLDCSICIQLCLEFNLRIKAIGETAEPLQFSRRSIPGDSPLIIADLVDADLHAGYFAGSNQPLHLKVLFKAVCSVGGVCGGGLI